MAIGKWWMGKAVVDGMTNKVVTAARVVRSALAVCTAENFASVVLAVTRGDTTIHMAKVESFALVALDVARGTSAVQAAGQMGVM